jgi:hypothetical protein
MFENLVRGGSDGQGLTWDVPFEPPPTSAVGQLPYSTRFLCVWTDILSARGRRERRDLVNFAILTDPTSFEPSANSPSRSLGQAHRISGIAPADVTVLAIHYRRH